MMRRDAIRPHVLGSFRELLQATAEESGDVTYLDNWQARLLRELALLHQSRKAHDCLDAIRTGCRN